MFEFEVTERQIHLLIDSLDMYSRIWMGQFCRLREYLWMYRRLCHDSTFEACVEDLMFAVRALFNPKAAEVGHFGSLGIWSPEICELAVSAYDMQQVIRHEYSWFVHPEGDIGVSFDDPHLRGFLPVPQATCHTLENGEVGMSISMEEEPLNILLDALLARKALLNLRTTDVMSLFTTDSRVLTVTRFVDDLFLEADCPAYEGSSQIMQSLTDLIDHIADMLHVTVDDSYQSLARLRAEADDLMTFGERYHMRGRR